MVIPFFEICKTTGTFPQQKANLPAAEGKPIAVGEFFDL